MNQHLSSRFDEDLDRLRSNVLQMGGVVETQIASAVNTFETGEIDAVKHIVETDQKVNHLEKVIDDDCAHVIAKRQPTASDLRLVLGISKIVTDLERVGDEAKKIAKGALRIYEHGHSPIQYGGIGIRHMADTALGLLRQTLDAFARLDTTEAGTVIQKDAEIDVEFKATVRQLITHMMEDPRTISVAIDILWIARAIERIGDHAKNIAEQVVFIVDGRDIRHTGKEAA